MKSSMHSKRRLKYVMKSRDSRVIYTTNCKESVRPIHERAITKFDRKYTEGDGKESTCFHWDPKCNSLYLAGKRSLYRVMREKMLV